MFDSLLCNTFQGGVVVETEIASVNDVVGLCLLRKVVQGSEVTCQNLYPSACVHAPELGLEHTSSMGEIKLTSNVSDTENADSSSLDDTTLVGEQRDSTRSWNSLGRTAGSTIGEVAGVVVVARGLLVRLRW